MRPAVNNPFKYPRPRVDTRGNAGQSYGDRSGPGKPKARAKNWKNTLLRIWRYLAYRKVQLSLVLLFVLISTGLSLLGPYMIGVAVDDYLEGSGGERWVWFLAGLAAVYIFGSLIGWLHNIWMIRIAQETVYRMRNDLFNHLHKLPIPYFGKRRQGEMMSRMTNDMDQVSSTLNASAIQIFSSALMLTGTTVVMLSLSLTLTALTLLVVPLMFIGMRWITKRTGALFKERQQSLGDLNGHIEETLSGQRIIKAFSQEERVIQEFEERNWRLRLAGFWAQTISGFIPKLMNAMNNLGFTLIVGAGGYLAIRDLLSVGTIIIFTEYARQFTRPLNDLANQWNTLLSAIAGAERVFETLDEATEQADEQNAKEIPSIRGEVAFQDVAFAYEQDQETLTDINFVANPGQTVAIVGPTGAGKTSLIQLLARFYDPSSGAITVDGHDIQGIKRESLRSHMAFVLQDTFLFEGSVRDNIRYGRLDATDEEVETAAKMANAHTFVMRLNDGYDHKLRNGGDGISQGQKQLLAIARAILSNPSILVLDEATSSIDTVTEIKIQEGFQRLMEGRTSFVIAHRLNTIRKADLILVLKEGRIIERGTHKELLTSGGFYRSLYQA